jgi:hypothetical protein
MLQGLFEEDGGDGECKLNIWWSCTMIRGFVYV